MINKRNNYRYYHAYPAHTGHGAIDHDLINKIVMGIYAGE